jgi:16S rRNA (uracil1498-N3)-methyltransferase
MSVPRFFIDTDFAVGEPVRLPPRVAHHAQHVLRLREGDPITLLNGRGGEYAARLVAGAPLAAMVELFDPVERESPLAVTLVQALVASEKIEWIIEKATEVGVARIVIAPSAHSTVKLVGDRLGTRVARWNEIAVAACCQCGRNRPPPVLYLPTLSSALTLAADCAARTILAPAAMTGMRFERAIRSIAIAVGPEGDWNQTELQQADRLGYMSARFGPRILRTETAGVAAITAVQAAAGDLDVRAAS